MEEGLILLVVAVAIGVITRGVLRERRLRVCPVCRGHDLTMVNFHRWSGKRTGGARTGGACTEYRCGGCGESLFAELSTQPMTKAEHEQWLEARHRDTHEAPPVARVHRKRRWWW